jgi:antitoxin component of MazEF toxin-antitoxin module
MKLRKRGNGQWLTIPAAIVRDRNLKSADEAQITQIGECEFELSRVCSQCGIVEKILTFSRTLPPDSMLNRKGIEEK